MLIIIKKSWQVLNLGLAAQDLAAQGLAAQGLAAHYGYW
jgi:hypothetical protein